MNDPQKTDIVYAHLYNPEAMRSVPGAIRAAELLGYRCDITFTRDSQDNIHSIVVTASIRHGMVIKIKSLP